MASLFEQYEQSAQKSVDLMATSQFHPPSMATSRMVPLSGRDDEPIFNKRRINFKATSPITCMAVSNNCLVMGLANRTLLRFDLARSDQPEELDFSKLVDWNYYAKVRRLFLDFSGNHLLVSLQSKDGQCVGDSLYLHKSSRKPKLLNKLKGHVISAIAWELKKNFDSAYTGPVLVGTHKGNIFETSFQAVEDRLASLAGGGVEQYCKHLYDLSRDGATSITGIEYHKATVSSPSGKTDQRCFILVTTPGRLYQFMGTVPATADHPVMMHVFNNYPDIPMRFQDIPSSLPYSQLQFFYPSTWSLPKAFVWMTGVGLLYGGMDYSGHAGPDSVTMETKLIYYPKENSEIEKDPLAVVLTEFHALVLYSDRVKGICVLNEQLVMEDVYTETYGSVVQLVKDPITGNIWTCSEYAVYKYVVKRESRNAWQVYLNRGEYALAKEYCKDDPARLDHVITKQAEDYFSRKNYEESAIHYAMTQVSFEEIALKFLQVDQKSALKTFLMKKLSSLRPQDKTQLTMLVTWLVEIFLNEIGKCKDDGRTSTATSLRTEFENFLKLPKVKDCGTNNSHVIYQLLASHGDHPALVYFAQLIQDYERMIEFQIQNGNYREALDVLQKQKRVDLVYQFSPVLMQHVPTETVNACIALGKRLEPEKLIPALVHYNSNRNSSITSQNESIRYLEFCVRTLDVKQRTIHNYLLSLYAKSSLRDKLVDYMRSQGQDAATVCYDLEYALRVCADCRLDDACVHIYAVMGLYEEAVDLALTFNVELAKQYAERPEGNEELRKKLWLKIAHHVVSQENDIKRAMEFLQECDLIKIEDILPCFPNFVTIDHFKDSICQSLEEYNQHIESLKEEMEEATASTKQIRDEIQQFRNKCVVMRSPHTTCSSCSFQVLTQSFYLFPCRHFFHAKCLAKEVLPSLSSAKRQQVEELQKFLNNLGGQDDSSLNQSTQITKEQIRNKQTELEDILAAECPFCGEIIIMNIDQPFIDSSELEDINKSWE